MENGEISRINQKLQKDTVFNFSAKFPSEEENYNQIIIYSTYELSPEMIADCIQFLHGEGIKSLDHALSVFEMISSGVNFYKVLRQP